MPNMSTRQIKDELNYFIKLNASTDKVKTGQELILKIESILPDELWNLWAQFLSSHIFACLETKNEEKCKALLDSNYTADQQKFFWMLRFVYLSHYT